MTSSAVTDCKPLKSISLPEVKSIDRYACQYCIGLETIYAPIVSSISDFAFAGCPKLKSVTLGNISAAGISIFDGVPTNYVVDLTLSKDQKVMTGNDFDGWRSDESKYARSDDHIRRRFLEKAMSYTYDVKIGKDKVTIGSVSVADWGKGDAITGGDAVTTTENAVLIIKNALAAGNTNIEIRNLPANADKSVFDAIREALKRASDGSID